MNYFKDQLNEQKETNALLYLNTIFTIITGAATIILSIIAIVK